MTEKLIRGWEALDTARQKGRTRSGAPMRSIKESMIGRARGERAAMGYLSGAARRDAAATTGTLKTIAKAAGKVGVRVGGTVLRAVAPPLAAYDVYDTAKTVHETVGAARELGRVRAAGRAAEQGTADIEKAMKAKYPLAGTGYEAVSKKLPKIKQGTTIGGGILKVN